MEVILNREVVFNESSSELWGDLPWHQFLTRKEILRSDRARCGIDVYASSDTDSEAGDIPIEDMKALIQKAENAGANYIQIDWHCDHEEYDVYGSRISRKSKEELDKYKKNKSDSKKLEKIARIETLEAEIKRLKMG
tara:strand:- start:7943 stop:8353 length:411 start_codon:yes stop_codon:yes gene_type:complete